jgi:hypothetical protein
MLARISFPCSVRLLLGLVAAVLSTLWLAPSAKAQTVTMPSSMNNNSPIYPGDTFQVGFQVEIADDTSGGTTVSVTGASAQVSVSCPSGNNQTLTVNIPAQSVYLSGYQSGWSPSSNTYQGQITAPSSLCGGQQGRINGIVFTATYGQKCDGDNDRDDQECCHIICFRFRDQCDHHGQLWGGSWDDDDETCKQQKQCISSQQRNHCNCNNQH